MAARTESPPASSHHDSSGTSTARILLVHLDPEFQNRLARTLKNFGHRIVTAETGTAAMVLFATTKIDMVIADEELRDIAAEQFLEHMKQACLLTPVILVTTRENPAWALRLIRAGAMDVISVGYSAEQLAEVCNRGLAQTNSRRRLLADSTYRQNAEQLVAEREIRLGAVLASTLDPLLTVSSKGIIESASDSVERVFGWTPAELIGQNVKVLAPAPHSQKHDQYIQAYFDTGKTEILGQSREVEAVRRDGSRFPCEITVWRTEIPGQQSPLFTGILRDITKRKAAEEAIEKYAQDLEFTNDARDVESARMRDLAEELTFAHARAEQAARVKSEFLANMSHEIRTPMTAILGFSDQLTDPDVSEEDRHEIVEIIQRNGRHLLDIINDILDLSKIEADRMTVEPLACPLMPLVDDVISLLKHQADAKQIALALKCPGKLPSTIHTDPTRLKQILTNLLGNAVKFTEQGSVTLTVELLPPTEGGAALLAFHITDTGIGISAEQLERLFEPFSQADNSVTRRYGGTGLGLTISQKLARQLGGDITVTSDLGQSSTFTVIIDPGPLDAQEMRNPATAAADTVACSPPADETAQPLSGRKVLLAEDGPDNQRLVSLILKKAGAEVEIVENGEMAVQRARAACDGQQAFDVILMDMQMPVLDGYGATQLLRESGYTRPIIALTAHALSSDREKCLNAGCDGYATKPINRKQLISIVAKYAAAHNESPAEGITC